LEIDFSSQLLYLPGVAENNRYNNQVHYIIDGHNLIPALGLNLADPEDEEQLLGLLQAFVRCHKKARITVYFDAAPQAQTRNLGSVKALFVPLGSSADAAIMAALRRAKKAARNLTVVSSDRQIQAAARAAHAAVMSSQDFAAQMRARPAASEPYDATYPSADEVAAWEVIFNNKKNT
jgi:predicted RNA-binding protein with PIN domain